MNKYKLQKCRCGEFLKVYEEKNGVVNIVDFTNHLINYFKRKAKKEKNNENVNRNFII